ncbi:hypothetical protein niasHT_033303 [Heterodera trifolii]|uniref:JmjC domain-containing protein n=1 Tax=Heterodera trifolii TaxID=157864 RepID=A0ABD2I994_9BILA
MSSAICKMIVHQRLAAILLRKKKLFFVRPVVFEKHRVHFRCVSDCAGFLLFGCPISGRFCENARNLRILDGSQFLCRIVGIPARREKWSAVWKAGGLGIRFRNEQLKQAAARRTTGAGEAQQAVEECQPGTSRRKQQFTAKVYEENGLPAEIEGFPVQMERIGVCRRDGALSYLIVGNGFNYYIGTVLTTKNLGTEILAFTDESEAGIERYFNEFVSGSVPKNQWYYGSQWFAPPAETTDSYRQITQLMESCNGPYVKMTSLPDDARKIRGLCAPPATSAFALHREEEHVHHLNYNLGPGLKLWLLVGGQWEKKAMELGKALFGDRWPRCRNPFGHNSFFFSPAQLRKAGIPFEFHIQRPGDAVLTVGLHCGINVGVKELCNHRAARQFKLIGQNTRCDCRSSREFYQYSEEQSQEYLEGVKEMESSAKEKARKLRYEQSGIIVRGPLARSSLRLSGESSGLGRRQKGGCQSRKQRKMDLW